MVCPFVAAATAVSRLVKTVAEGNAVARLVGQPTALREAVAATTSLTVAGNVPAAFAFEIVKVSPRANKEMAVTPTVIRCGIRRIAPASIWFIRSYLACSEYANQASLAYTKSKKWSHRHLVHFLGTSANGSADENRTRVLSLGI